MVARTGSECQHCGTEVEPALAQEYTDVRAAVEAVLSRPTVPPDAAPQCVELVTGLLHPLDPTYIAILQLAITDCLLQVDRTLCRDVLHHPQDRLGRALEYGRLLLGSARRLARGSPAQLELTTRCWGELQCSVLVRRLMRVAGELGRVDQVEQLAQGGLADGYANSDQCRDILQLRDRIMQSKY